MGSKNANKKLANSNSNPPPLNQKLLDTCHQLYNGLGAFSGSGLLTIASAVGLDLAAPPRKVKVLLLGNHSAGKSSFSNYYIGETIQSTGVAIESTRFTFCLYGKQRETLGGAATLRALPWLKPLAKLEPYLQTELVTSTERQTKNITLIDTPGLVDGNFEYGYDLVDSLIELSKQVELVFCFFDPIGQALCNKTLEVVEKLDKMDPSKLHFFVSKADTLSDPMDRQKTLIQITQMLSGRIHRQFDLPTLYLPALAPNSRVPNAIDSACDLVNTTVKRTVQRTLEKVGDDVVALEKRVNLVEKENATKVSHNRWKVFWGLLWIVVLGLYLFGIAWGVKEYGLDQVKALEYRNEIFGSAAGFAVALLILAIYQFKTRKPVFSSKKQKQLKEWKTFVNGRVVKLKDSMLKEYLAQSMQREGD